MVMAETRESTLRYRESLLLMITGYDNDRRELPEIPQVRRFMSRLTDEWPHWLWFLSREQGAISLLMSLLCTVKIHRAEHQQAGSSASSSQIRKNFQTGSSISWTEVSHFSRPSTFRRALRTSRRKARSPHFMEPERA